MSYRLRGVLWKYRYLTCKTDKNKHLENNTLALLEVHQVETTKFLLQGIKKTQLTEIFELEKNWISMIVQTSACSDFPPLKQEDWTTSMSHYASCRFMFMLKHLSCSFCRSPFSTKSPLVWPTQGERSRAGRNETFLRMQIPTSWICANASRPKDPLWLHPLSLSRSLHVTTRKSQLIAVSCSHGNTGSLQTIFQPSG